MTFFAALDLPLFYNAYRVEEVIQQLTNWESPTSNTVSASLIKLHAAVSAAGHVHSLRRRLEAAGAARAQGLVSALWGEVPDEPTEVEVLGPMDPVSGIPHSSHEKGMPLNFSF